MATKTTAKPAAKTAKAKAKTKPATKAKPAAKPKTKPAAKPTAAKKVVLLSGGNPQIAKGDGDGPVQAYLAAIPGWKRAMGERIDAVVVRAVPGVRKAVKWNSPFYGVEGQGWFLSFHVFAQYVKVTFFKGSSLRPVPPGPSKQPEVRYADLREGQLDEAQLAAWVTQAAKLPGWLA
jgi:hypothetical protein